MTIKCVLIIRSGKEVTQRSFTHSDALPKSVAALKALLQQYDFRLESGAHECSVSAGKAAPTNLKEDAEVKAFFSKLKANEVTFDVTLGLNPDALQMPSMYMDDDIVSILIFPPLAGSNLAGAKQDKTTDIEGSTHSVNLICTDVAEKTFIIPITGALTALRRTVADTLKNTNALIDYGPRLSIYSITDPTVPPTALVGDSAVRKFLQGHAKASTNAKITYSIADAVRNPRENARRNSFLPSLRSPASAATPTAATPSAATPTVATPMAATPKTASPTVASPTVSPSGRGSPPPPWQAATISAFEKAPSPVAESTLAETPRSAVATVKVCLVPTGSGGDSRPVSAADQVLFPFSYSKSEMGLLDRFRAECAQRAGASTTPTAAASFAVVVVVGGCVHTVGNDGDLREWMALSRESEQPLRTRLDEAAAAAPSAGIPEPSVHSSSRAGSPVVKTEVTATTVHKKFPPAFLQPTAIETPAAAAKSTERPSVITTTEPAAAPQLPVLKAASPAAAGTSSFQGVSATEAKGSAAGATKPVPAAAASRPTSTTAKQSFPKPAGALLPDISTPPIRTWLANNGDTGTSPSSSRQSPALLSPSDKPLGAPVRGSLVAAVASACAPAVALSSVEVRMPKVSSHSHAATPSVSRLPSRATSPAATSVAGDGRAAASTSGHPTRASVPLSRSASPLPRQTAGKVDKPVESPPPESATTSPIATRSDDIETAAEPLQAADHASAAQAKTEARPPPAVTVTMPPAEASGNETLGSGSPTAQPSSPRTVLRGSSCAAQPQTTAIQFYACLTRTSAVGAVVAESLVLTTIPTTTPSSTPCPVFGKLHAAILQSLGYSAHNLTDIIASSSLHLYELDRERTIPVTHLTSLQSLHRCVDRLSLDSSYIELRVSDSVALKAHQATAAKDPHSTCAFFPTASTAIHAFAARLQPGSGVNHGLTLAAAEAVLRTAGPDASKLISSLPTLQNVSPTSVLSGEQLAALAAALLMDAPGRTLDAVGLAVARGGLTLGESAHHNPARHTVDPALLFTVDSALRSVSQNEMEALIAQSQGPTGNKDSAAASLVSVAGALLAVTPVPSYGQWAHSLFSRKLAPVVLARMGTVGREHALRSCVPLEALHQLCWEVLKVGALLERADTGAPAADASSTLRAFHQWCLAAAQVQCHQQQVQFPPLPAVGAVTDAIAQVYANDTAVARALTSLPLPKPSRGGSAGGGRSHSTSGGRAAPLKSPLQPPSRKASSERQNSKVQFPSLPAAGSAADAIVQLNEKDAAATQASGFPPLPNHTRSGSVGAEKEHGAKAAKMSPAKRPFPPPQRSAPPHAGNSKVQYRFRYQHRSSSTVQTGEVNENPKE